MDWGRNGNTSYSYYVYTELDMLKEKHKQFLRKKPIPGQPVNNRRN